MRGTAVAVVAALAPFVSPAGAAAGTLDQSQTTFNTSVGVGQQKEAAQTFTAGLTGPLDQVEVYVRLRCPPSGSGLTVEIQSTTGGAPSDVTLASALVPPASVPTNFGWVSVTFAAPASVTAGVQYALALSATNANNCGSGGGSGGGPPDPAYLWGFTGSNTYGGGRAWFKDPALGSSSWMVNGDTDLTFKTYVVTPSPPPDDTTPPPDDTTPPPVDTDPPETALTTGVPNKTEKTTIKFKFISDEPGSTFQCKFDKKPWKACTSPKTVKRLDEGKHKFKVRAIDPAGNPDLTPDKDKFKVVE